MYPVIGKSYETQGYGLTPYAKSPAGQRAYKGFPGGIHAGRDIGTHGINLPVVSSVAGKIVTAKMDGGWGNHVEVLGEDGWRRQYAHLQSIAVQVGDEIEAGKEIGKVGTTGASTGVHLHVGKRRRKLTGGWEYADPANDWIVTKVTGSTSIKEPKMPKSVLIQSNKPGERGVYVWDGVEKFAIPGESTAKRLFGEKWQSKIEKVEHDVFVKLPEGQSLPVIR